MYIIVNSNVNTQCFVYILAGLSRWRARALESSSLISHKMRDQRKMSTKCSRENMDRVKRFHFNIDLSSLGKTHDKNELSFVTLSEESLEKVRDLVMKELLAYNQELGAKDVTTAHAQHVNEFVIETGGTVHF